MPERPRRPLPANPSEENLRKRAKQRAKSDGVQLAVAQRRIAADHGYPNWAALLEAARAASRARAGVSALSEAAARADMDAVRDLLARGEPVEGSGETSSPLWRVCDGAAPADRRIAVVELLLDAGASPRRESEGRATPLHAAVRRGPLALVELLIRRGALSWQGDRRGKTALDYARKGTADDRALIVELLDRPVMRDGRFRTAVGLIHAGDADALARLLDERPDLLRIRAVEPDCYPRDYFRDPKLFWFIANNPTLMKAVPANIAEIGRLMVARGVEQEDLDYTLELVMSSGEPTAEGHQAELMEMLIDAGAHATPRSILMTLAHSVRAPVEMLLERGHALTAPIAAALDRCRELQNLLPQALAADRQAALGLAVINGRLEAVRLCLDAGADPNQPLPVHRHSLPAHHAAMEDNVPMLKLLVERGARLDIPDTLWRSTPLGWAVHGKKAAAEAFLRQAGAG